MKKASILAVSAVLAALVVTAIPKSALGQGKTGPRWHGVVTRISEDGSVYTVRKGTVEKSVHVTADTKFTKTEGKKAVDIDKGDVKEGDDVICIGKAGEKEFVAERIDKRLPK
ncbi:MAG: hypothetical protein ACM3NO_09840 [Deltaproteobacteria bacterium]